MDVAQGHMCIVPFRTVRTAGTPSSPFVDFSVPIDSIERGTRSFGGGRWHGASLFWGAHAVAFASACSKEMMACGDGVGQNARFFCKARAHKIVALLQRPAGSMGEFRGLLRGRALLGPEVGTVDFLQASYWYR
jgi:hypothetical protein